MHDLLVQKLDFDSGSEIVPPKNYEVELERLVIAIRLCINNDLHGPALILIYATMDILANLGRDAEHRYVKKDDFLRWVELYLLPDSDLQCSPVDLYGARCGILHSYSPVSNLSNIGSAKMLIHVWGSASEAEYLKPLERTEPQNVLVIHVEKLFTALAEGIIKFRENFQDVELLEKRGNEMSGNWAISDIQRQVSRAMTEKL